MLKYELFDDQELIQIMYHLSTSVTEVFITIFTHRSLLRGNDGKTKFTHKNEAFI